MESLCNRSISWLFSLLTVAAPLLVYGCTCPPSPVSFEMNFCLAAYSYKGDIVSVQIVEDEGTFTQYYDVFVDEIYHGMEEEEEGAIIVLTTGIDKCGKPGLSKGSHLFQGRGSSRELTSCDIAEPFQSLDESDIENLRSGTYSKNCAYFYDVVCLPTTVRPDVTMEETTKSPRFPDGMTTADT